MALALLGKTMLLGRLPKLTLCRLDGIPIRLEASFVLVPIFALTGSTSRLSDDAVLPAAAAVTLGIFFSILLHELGHAAAARWQQTGVTEIVVGGFFGYAVLKRQAIPRKVLIRIFASGPFANLLIFLALWAVLSMVAPFGIGFNRLTQPVTASLGWQGDAARVIALVNLVMFIFNMLPAFPLDGGWILNLFLDRRLSPRTTLRVVSWVGLVAGAFMFLLGLGINIVLLYLGLVIFLMNLYRLRSKPASPTVT